MPDWPCLCRGGVSSVQEAAVWWEPGGHRENDPFRQGAPEHERTPPPRVWQELSQQEDAQGNTESLLYCISVGKVSRMYLCVRQHSFQAFAIYLTYCFVQTYNILKVN